MTKCVGISAQPLPFVRFEDEDDDEDEFRGLTPDP